MFQVKGELAECSWCRFWREFDKQPEQYKLFGSCHRYPGKMKNEARLTRTIDEYSRRMAFPHVSGDDFCGEFKPDAYYNDQ